jgi:Lrp/AsnC family transcriptional regulator for asnA, asnC and gidA
MQNIISIEQVDQLDETDAKIVEALRKDGRVAFAQIAEQLNVSPGMIRQRYNRLVDMGYLKVLAITNPSRLGIRTMAMIGIRTDGDKLLQVAEQMTALEEVIYVVVVSGRYDILAEVYCRDHADLLKFLTEKLAKIKGVRETETFMHLRIMKEVYF